MLCLDSSALVAHLRGNPEIIDVLDAHAEEGFTTPTVAYYEVCLGVTREHGADALAQLHDDLQWVEPLPFSAAHASEAATIDAQLHDDGQPIGALDTLIAGAARHAGATLCTGDRDFQHVPDLDVVDYTE